MGGEEVKVLGDGQGGADGQALIGADGGVGWIELALLHEGPLPGVEELTEDARRRWRAGDQKALLRPLQTLRYLHGIDLANLDLPVTAAVAETLTGILPVATRGDGESHSRREIVDLVIEQILGDSTPEIRLRTRTGYWEGWGETLEILHGIGEGPSVRRFVVRTLEDDLFESVFRRFPHVVDLDEDPDLEIAVLEGTLSFAPEDNARTWKLRLYDFAGRRFSEVAWIPALKDFLRQRLEEAEDPLEKTILRSHFGITASRNGE